MLAYMMALALFVGSPGPDAKPRKGEATAQYILTLRPNLPRARAWKLGWLIEHYGDRYGVDPKLMAVIIRQESYFDPGLRACWDRTKPDGTLYQTCDYGIAQINQVWIETWGLDPEKLQHDDGYGISVMARILKQLQVQYQEQERKWWGRYNSATPSKRALYESRIDLHFATLEAMVACEGCGGTGKETNERAD